MGWELSADCVFFLCGIFNSKLEPWLVTLVYHHKRIFNLEILKPSSTFHWSFQHSLVFFLKIVTFRMLAGERQWSPPISTAGPIRGSNSNPSFRWEKRLWEVQCGVLNITQVLQMRGVSNPQLQESKVMHFCLAFHQFPVLMLNSQSSHRRSHLFPQGKALTEAQQPSEEARVRLPFGCFLPHFLPSQTVGAN